MNVHNFRDQLEYSHKASVEGMFDSAYRWWFPGLTRIELVEDRAMQRRGIDKILHFSEGNAFTVDEKVRKKDFGDILIETVSVFQNGRKVKKGWIYTCQCDFIVYAIEPTNRAYLLPVPLLKKAWLKHEREWSNGYRSVTAYNEGYETISTVMPTRELLDAIKDEMIQQVYQTPGAGQQMTLLDFARPALYQPHEYTLEKVPA